MQTLSPFVIHITAECFPIAKVGGLADVAGALPKYQSLERCSSKLIMPYYDNSYIKDKKVEVVFEHSLHLGSTTYTYQVLLLDPCYLGFEVYLVKIKDLTDRKEIYGCADDVARFTAFQVAATQFINSSEKLPDIIHCHDHHTGLVPFFTKYAFEFEKLKDIPTIITIHNAQYQGYFGYDKLYYLPDFDHKHIGLLDWYGSINPLACAIKCAWKVTTVSPSYMNELQYKANHLEALLMSESQKCTGILNGIDAQLWNPATDKMLVTNYDQKNISNGKQVNKQWLCEEFDLNPDLPLVSFIGRFVYEKGSDLLAESISYLYDKMGLEVNILVLGSGDVQTTQSLEDIKTAYKGKYSLYVGYNEKLAHRIYAGSDFLLMPSRVEPCGLNQMYSLRYGTFPIVHHVGGLKDTIFNIDMQQMKQSGADKINGNGIVFHEVTSWNIAQAVSKAIHFYHHTYWFTAKREQLLAIDHSWPRSAKDYMDCYKEYL